MITLSKEQIIRLHEGMIFHTGGLGGIRDETLLESALLSPFQTFEGTELYPTSLSKIARIVYGLVSNHPFVDGNKRIGTLVMLILLELNQIKAEFDDEEIINIGIGLASGKMNDEHLYGLISRRILKQATPGKWLNDQEGFYIANPDHGVPDANSLTNYR